MFPCYVQPFICNLLILLLENLLSVMESVIPKAAARHAGAAFPIINLEDFIFRLKRNDVESII